MILNILVSGNGKEGDFIKQAVIKNRDLPFPLMDLSFKSFPKSEGLLYILSFKFKILRPIWICLIPLTLFIIFKVSAFFWISLGLIALEGLLSPPFIYVVYRIGLKKAGFEGSAKFVSNKRALEVLLYEPG